MSLELPERGFRSAFSLQLLRHGPGFCCFCCLIAIGPIFPFSHFPTCLHWPLSTPCHPPITHASDFRAKFCPTLEWEWESYYFNNGNDSSKTVAVCRRKPEAAVARVATPNSEAHCWSCFLGTHTKSTIKLFMTAF